MNKLIKCVISDRKQGVALGTKCWRILVVKTSPLYKLRHAQDLSVRTCTRMLELHVNMCNTPTHQRAFASHKVVALFVFMSCNIFLVLNLFSFVKKNKLYVQYIV